MAARLAPHEGHSPRPFAGKGDEKLVGAARASHPGEARFEQTAIEVPGDGSVVETSPETVASLEAIFPQAFDGLVVSFEELIEGCGARIPRAVPRRAGLRPREQRRSCRHGAHGGLVPP